MFRRGMQSVPTMRGAMAVAARCPTSTVSTPASALAAVPADIPCDVALDLNACAQRSNPLASLPHWASAASGARIENRAVAKSLAPARSVKCIGPLKVNVSLLEIRGLRCTGVRRWHRVD